MMTKLNEEKSQFVPESSSPSPIETFLFNTASGQDHLKT
jgi:hypothetical protein